ncbi:MAG: hypothetical protein ABJL72_17185 [Roseobacter sp.]
MRLIVFIALPFCLTACSSAVITPQPSTLPFLDAPYPAAGDLCRRLGESPKTADYLDHTADLIACPSDMPNLSDFIDQSGAERAFEQDGYVILSVPRGI